MTNIMIVNCEYMQNIFYIDFTGNGDYGYISGYILTSEYIGKVLNIVILLYICPEPERSGA